MAAFSACTMPGATEPNKCRSPLLMRQAERRRLQRVHVATPIASDAEWYRRRKSPIKLRLAIVDVLMVPGAHDGKGHDDEPPAAGDRSRGPPEGPRPQHAGPAWPRRPGSRLSVRRSSRRTLRAD